MAANEHTNWAGTFPYSPARYSEPENLAELIAAVREATAAGQVIRPRGIGHSSNAAIATSGCSISTVRMKPPGDNDEDPCTCKRQSPPPCGRSGCLDVTVVGEMVQDGRLYRLVSAPPGVNGGSLSLVAQELGCPLPMQGPATDITASGWTANGCHGSGWDQPTIAELVYGIELVGPGGKLFYFDEETAPPEVADLGSPREIMNIVRVHLGVLGVLSRIVFKLPVSTRNLLVGSELVPMTSVFDRNDPDKLKQLVGSHDYIEIFWFPYNRLKWNGTTPVPAGPESDRLWIITFDWTDDEPNADADLINLWSDTFGRLVVVGQGIGWLVERNPSLAPLAASFALNAMRWQNMWRDDVVMRPRDAFLYQKSYFKNYVDMEFTIPMEGEPGFSNVTRAFYQLVDRMEAWRSGASGTARYPVNLSFHARFLKSSQALLSPAYALPGSPAHTCYLEYISYGNGHLDSDFVAFNQDFFSAENGRGWMAFGGLPNWGKYLASIPDVFRYAREVLSAPSPHPGKSRLAAFLELRDRIDPGGKHFTHEYLAALFAGGELPAPKGEARALPPLRQLTRVLGQMISTVGKSGK